MAFRKCEGPGLVSIRPPSNLPDRERPGVTEDRNVRRMVLGFPAVDEDFWITPACAGKTPAETLICHLPPDHPRMRGEDKKVTKEGFQISGSPPHARGRPALLFRRFPDFGITPACAGKTQSAPSARSATPDHPRMRGEDRGSMRAGLSVQGSPPHARGRQMGTRSQHLGHGITPACAGKTPTAKIGRPRTPDHPRMRGEDGRHSRLRSIRPGSPPHARGRP